MGLSEQKLDRQAKRFVTAVRLSTIFLAVAVGLPVAAVGQKTSTRAAERVERVADRFPGENWMQYADVADAGFSPERLAEARRFWERRDSSAFLVLSGGAVVASWGEVDRRFMCHSLRKSFLSALYGVYKDDIDLELTISELNIDDQPPLTDQEKQARIVDLIRSRSGVYHEAAAEPEAMSKNRPARDSQEPGSHWWHNNWDFNTAGVVFEQQTGERIFEAFDKAIAEPIGMQDYRVSDGFYHYERDKSIHPGYMFRMSTRDLARFGLLFARGGRWKGKQVIPETWVDESTRPHSEIDRGSKYGSGYGYMWWIEGMQGYSARGSGGHMLAVYPARDLVMVIRADTYHDRSVSTRACVRLFDRVAKAGQDKRADAPRLVRAPSIEGNKRPSHTLSAKQLASYACEIEMDSGRKVTVNASDDELTIEYGYGTFRLWPESHTRFIAEDSEDPVLFELAADGRVSKIWAEQLCYLEAAAAVRQGNLEAAVTWVRQAVDKFPKSSRAHYNLARVLHGTDEPSEALAHVRKALDIDPRNRGASELLIRLQLRRFAWMIGILALLLGWQLILILFRRLDRFKPATAARAAWVEQGWPADQLRLGGLHGSAKIFGSKSSVDFDIPNEAKTIRVSLRRRIYSLIWRAISIEVIQDAAPQ